MQIFATDLDGEAIATARLGVYPLSIEEDVSPARLRRFFTAVDGGYRVSALLRGTVVFATQNLAREPPFSHLDLVSCRNVLIYVQPPLRRRILSLFHYALRAEGALLLGSSEDVSVAGDLFSAVDPRLRIFARRVTAAAPTPGAVRVTQRPRPARTERFAQAPGRAEQATAVTAVAATPTPARPERSDARERAWLARGGPRAAGSAGLTGGEATQAQSEELLAANEELRTSNEELEASGEELQSTNEELATLNDELQHSVAELGHSHGDLHNLLDAVDSALVIVGADLTIRRFTAEAARLFDLVAADVGRPLAYLARAMGVAQIEGTVSDVLRDGTAVEREVQDAQRRWHRLRVLPYQATDGSVHGAIVDLVPAAPMRRSGPPGQLHDHAEQVLRGMPQPLALLDHRMVVIWANEAFLAGFGDAGAHNGDLRRLWPRVPARAWARIERVLVDGIPIESLGARVTLLSGAERDARVSLRRTAEPWRGWMVLGVTFLATNESLGDEGNQGVG